MPLISLLMLASASQPPDELRVDLDRVRNAKGVIHACLTADARRFPDCKGDPRALTRTVPATARQLAFSGVAPGDYALTLFHDENANGKLDMVLGIPREGFGFSRNPVVRFGPPRYEKVVIRLGSGITRMRVRLQYIL